MQEFSTILIADDEQGIHELFSSFLTGPEYRLVFANNGKEAVEAAFTHAPDLVLLDVMMPEMDGFEACRRLRSDPRTKEIPILIITALYDHRSRLKGIEAGADDFISKPFDFEELSARIRSITRLNRYRTCCRSARSSSACLTSRRTASSSLTPSVILCWPIPPFFE